MYKLLGFPTQNSFKVLYVLEELGIDYQFELVNLMKGENRTEAFRKLNPMAKAPVLLHDNESLFESGAICRYVANVEESQLYPNQKLKRAKVDQWLDYFSCHLGRWLSTLFFEKIIKSKAQLGAMDEKSYQEAWNFSEQHFNIMDQWLKNHRYLIGDDLTIADLCAFAYIEQVEALDFSIEKYTSVSTWYNQLKQRESIQRAKKRISINN